MKFMTLKRKLSVLIVGAILLFGACFCGNAPVPMDLKADEELPYKVGTMTVFPESTNVTVQKPRLLILPYNGCVSYMYYFSVEGVSTSVGCTLLLGRDVNTSLGYKTVRNTTSFTSVGVPYGKSAAYVPIPFPWAQGLYDGYGSGISTFINNGAPTAEIVATGIDGYISSSPYSYIFSSIPADKNIGVTVVYDGYIHEMVFDPSVSSVDEYQFGNHIDLETGRDTPGPLITTRYVNNAILISANRYVELEEYVDVTSDSAAISIYYLDK